MVVIERMNLATKKEDKRPQRYNITWGSRSHRFHVKATTPSRLVARQVDHRTNVIQSAPAGTDISGVFVELLSAGTCATAKFAGKALWAAQGRKSWCLVASITPEIGVEQSHHHADISCQQNFSKEAYLGLLPKDTV